MKPREMNREPVTYPIDGTLDLHIFKPADVGELLGDYIEECRMRGILRVRIIHGKGRGVLRAHVRSLLKKIECVESFKPADETGGGWGATIVFLRPARDK